MKTKNPKFNQGAYSKWLKSIGAPCFWPMVTKLQKLSEKYLKTVKPRD